VNQGQQSSSAVSPAERWAQLFDALPLPIATLAADGTVLEVNRAAAALNPSPKSQRTPRNFREFVPPSYQARIAEAIQSALAGKIARIEVVYHVGDGALRTGEATFVPWNDPSGQAVALALLRDTSLEQEARADLVQMSKLATAGELLAGVTHELNNPLTVVLSLAEMLEARPDLAPDVRSDLRDIRREAQRATQIVRQLLAFVRRHDPERLPVDLNGVITDTVALRRGALALAAVETELDLDDIPRVPGDPHQLQQMVLNLLTNAEHALQQVARGPRRLAIRTRAHPGQVELAVHDSGPGIPEDVLPRIFDPFVTTKPAGQGTGLGLSIVSRIVREHGGRIQAANAPDGGAVFTILLPAEEFPGTRTP
jgi:two-component system NtrC family sensor kinase